MGGIFLMLDSRAAYAQPAPPPPPPPVPAQPVAGKPVAGKPAPARPVIAEGEPDSPAEDQKTLRAVGLGVDGPEHRAENWTPVFGTKTMRHQQATASDPML